jgi:hypothetical protein
VPHIAHAPMWTFVTPDAARRALASTPPEQFPASEPSEVNCEIFGNVGHRG